MNVSRLVRSIDDFWLESDRLALRRFRPEDLEPALQQELDPRMIRYVRDPAPIEVLAAKVEGHLEPYTGREGEWVALPIVPRGTGRMVGLLALRVTDAARGVCEIGYRLDPGAQGKGLMVEACTLLLDFLFSAIGVEQVVACCDPDNAASIRLLQKLGMRQQARLCGSSMLGGELRDDLVFGLSSADWQQRRAAGEHGGEVG